MFRTPASPRLGRGSRGRVACITGTGPEFPVNRTYPCPIMLAKQLFHHFHSCLPNLIFFALFGGDCPVRGFNIVFFINAASGGNPPPSCSCVSNPFFLYPIRAMIEHVHACWIQIFCWNLDTCLTWKNITNNHNIMFYASIFHRSNITRSIWETRWSATKWCMMYPVGLVYISHWLMIYLPWTKQLWKR